MGILDNIISELPSDELVEQLHRICKDILEEELPKCECIEYASDGPNVLITLQVPGRYKKEVGFLSLEREGPETYLVVFSTLPKSELNKKSDEALPPKRQRVWEVKDHRSTKIMTEFAKKVKFLRGE